MRWGERLEFTAEAGPGDFIYVPPFVPHQEINANRDQELSCVVGRSGQEPGVVNLDIAPPEPPEEAKGIDPIHRCRGTALLQHWGCYNPAVWRAGRQLRRP